MDGPAFDTTRLTPDWLTNALRRSGTLTEGHAAALEIASHEATVTASVVRFNAVYSSDARGHLPTRFFLKLSEREPEGWFYRHLAPEMQIGGILPCYDVIDREQGVWLLFEDKSATHSGGPDGAPIPLETLQARVDLIADFQAHWWEHPRLNGDIGDFADDVRGFIEGVTRRHLPQYMDAVADVLTPAWKTRLERVMVALPLPEWVERIRARRQITLVHGDTHEFNFLYPRQPGGTLYLVDWAVWHLNTGPTDIAYLMPSELDQPTREGLLRRYHDRLLANGVTGYDWDVCWLDYRRAILEGMVWPVWCHYINLGPATWRSGIIGSMTQADALGCDELLP
jgi:hypothetical protein